MNIEIQNRTQTSPHHKCLNCSNVVENNFCPAWGQKASTHRYSLEHFFVHDLVHGVFHFDKGFFYTLKELFTRPGHSIREFIEGKRTNHFNYFSFALIALVVSHYLKEFSSIEINKLYSSVDKISGYQKVAKDYYKILAFTGIPFLSLVNYFIFRKSKQNYTEHLIMNVYRVSVAVIILTIFYIITIFYSNMEFLGILFNTIGFIEIGYSTWFFYQYFSVFDYKKKNLIFRSIVAAISVVAINNGLIRYILNQIGHHFF